MMTDAGFEARIEEWARWVQGGYVAPGLGYSPVSPMFKESVKSDRLPVPCYDRELEVERAVAALARSDRQAADVLRAHYRAHPRFGHPDLSETASVDRTAKRLGIGRSTYFKKLDKAKTAIQVAIDVMVA